MVKLDRDYVQNWSLPLDIWIILRTFVVVFAGRGVLIGLCCGLSFYAHFNRIKIGQALRSRLVLEGLLLLTGLTVPPQPDAIGHERPGRSFKIFASAFHALAVASPFVDGARR
jgi:hypothetical protein